MPYITKSWCVHPCHATIDPTTGQNKFTKNGPNPTHPLGKYRLDTAIAADINKQYSLVTGSTSKRVSKGDKICGSCWKKMSKQEFGDDNEDMSVDNAEWINSYNNNNNNDNNNNNNDNNNNNNNNNDNNNNSDNNINIYTYNDNEQRGDDPENLPSSQEKRHTKEEAKRKLNAVFELLNIPTIRDIRRIKHIRENIYAACSALHTLCDMLLETEEQPVNQHLSGKDTNLLLSGFHNLFQQSGDNEQVRLLTIAPDYWGRIMIQKWFNCSEHQARQGILLKKNKGFLAFPEYSNGNKALPDSTIKLVTEFYSQDGISRASPRKKDIIHINKAPIPVRFMEITGREAFQQFIIDNPSIVIGKSSFYALKPRQVKYNVPLDTCLCIYHENMHLLLKAWSNFLKKNLPGHNIDLELINETYVVNRIICGIPTEDCFNRCCHDCSTINPTKILLDNIDINNDEILSWSQWMSLKNKIDLLHINGSISSLMNEIDSQWDTFLLHCETSYIVAQLDFAENYTIFHQREVQGFHWNNQQVTVFTVHLKVGSNNKNIVIISDYMLHNTNFVYVAQELIVKFIKHHFPLVKKINYLSDGACSHFKNNFNMLNLIHHQQDFDLEACWTFTSTGHGKGPCDGLGASVKSTATRHITTSGISISSAEEFYKFTVQFNEDIARASINKQPPIHAFYVNSSTVENAYNRVLKSRWEKLNKTNRIKHIRSFHQFNVRSDRTILCKHTSNSLNCTMFMFQINDNFQSTVKRIHTSSDFDVGMLVIVIHNDNFYLVKIKAFNSLAQEVQVQYYEPPFPSTTFYVSRSKNRNSSNVSMQHILLLLLDPVVGKKEEVYLNLQQFNEIENICEEF
ncbi:unnamed protein product [Rotaria sp. Silwood1]|nr:unnamed protein product [Rotaria sp. Silwood1]CAF5013566.1 unnamed protein product [Rotaria sp. Silwood1]